LPDTLTCPNCQADQPAEAVFCDNCGHRLTPGLEVTAQPEAATAARGPGQVVATPQFLRPGPDRSAGQVICPNCQTANLAGASFCDNCGTMLPPDLPVSPPAAEPSAGDQPPTQRDLPVVQTQRRPAPAAKPRPEEVRAGQVEPGVGAPQRMRAESPTPGRVANSQTYIEPGAGLGSWTRSVGRLVILATGAVLMLPDAKPEILVGREDPVSNIFPEIDLAPHGGEAGGVSRRHAQFVVQGNTVFIEDLESTNFTFVNRQRVMPGVRQVVRHGDEVRFGRVAARYEGP
jgi:hypothetical protein